ncbi:MAG: damage-control phosphatase ARMT1 family protein [Elusimicrobiota bacterium]
MKMEIDCVTCFMRQAVKAAKLSTDNFEIQLKAVKKAAEKIADIDPEKTPPETATGVFKTIIRQTGQKDAFKKLKDDSNRKVKNLIPRLEKLIQNAEDPFKVSLNLALCGNIIDYGILEDFNVEELIERELNKELDSAKLKKLKSRILGADKISFLADNAGEIGFDGLFLKQLKKLNPDLEIVVFVNDRPIINDVTMEDMRFFGLDETFEIVEAPNTVGLDYKNLPENFKKLLEQSDYIISKGQANYEILTGTRLKNIIYLLRAKCPVVARSTGVKEGARVVIL